MPWTPDRLPDLTGQTILITGANGGLGYETASALAAKGAHVVMASRKTARSGEAKEQIRERHPDASIEVRELDLSSLKSVRYFAERMRLDHPYLDAIVCNAGVMGVPASETDDGFDRQWQVNHLGHFELVRLLWETLMANGGGRVVTVTSFARHFRGDFDPDDPPIRGTYRRWKAYGQTKMANLRFAVEVDRRARAAAVPVRGIATHPGLSHTRRNTTRPPRPPKTLLQRISRWWIRRFGMDPARGAHSQIRAATDPRARGGRLYAPRFMTVGASVRRPLLPWTRRVERGIELWEASERQLGERFEIGARE
jgi:NAD(P)-dependent dehydrogenase (short-subunit alcohol dehydrogenase family)